jgi:hypothetical protein
VNEIYDLRKISWIIAGSMIIQAAIGMVQVMRGSSIGLMLMGERVLAPASYDVSLVSIPGGNILRAYGLADHPNILGGVLVCSLLIYLTSLLSSSITNIQSISLAVFSLGISGLLLTFSQSAWIAGLIALAWFTWRLARSHNRKALYGLGMIMLAGAIILLPFLFSMSPYIMETLIPGSMMSQPAGEGQLSTQRATLNQAANQIFAGHALTGIGLGAFPTALFQSRPDFGYDIEPPHLSLLEAAAETGIFGAMFYLVLVIAPWPGMWLYRKRLVMTIPLIGTSAALLAMSIIGWMDYYPWLMAPGLIWQFILWGFWSKAFLQSMETRND